MAAQVDVNDLDKELDNNIYEPTNILDEVNYGMDVMARALKVKPIYFVGGVSRIDYMYLATRINGHASNVMIDSEATH